jgi:hypothetical protein
VEFTTEDFGGARLVVSDEPNVLQLILHDSVRYEAGAQGAIINLWEMAKILITEWEADALPDMNADLSEVTDPRAARLIEWAGVTVSAFRRGLDIVPKNS